VLDVQKAEVPRSQKQNTQVVLKSENNWLLGVPWFASCRRGRL
jgi:hypothetical protein